MQNIETHPCPADSRYSVVLDHREAVPADPGAGTPAMVYGPQNTAATFGCALDTGDLECGEHALPPAVARWLDEISDYVDGYVNAAFDNARKAGR